LISLDFSQFSRNIEHLCFKRLDFQFSAPIHVTSKIHDSEIVHTIKSDIRGKQSNGKKPLFFYRPVCTEPNDLPVNQKNHHTEGETVDPAYSILHVKYRMSVASHSNYFKTFLVPLFCLRSDIETDWCYCILYKLSKLFTEATRTNRFSTQKKCPFTDQMQMFAINFRIIIF
jgi:hypothetical protein